MPTYLVKKEIKITRQAGDDCDVVFQIPDSISLISTDFKFAVFTINESKQILLKEGVDISYVEPTLTATIVGSETQKYSGIFQWELEATINSRKTTIGKGQFELIKTRLK